MNCRKDVKDLTPTEKAAFVQALIDLKQAPSQISAAQTAGGQGRYDDYVWIHRQVLGSAHNASAFTPWHREFLYQLERDLQTVSGDPSLTVPYWDWTKARGPSDPGWPFTADFLGGLGIDATDSRVTTGRFATDPNNAPATEWRINVRDAETENHLKRRGAGEEFPLPALGQARNAMGVATYDEAPFVLTASMSNAEVNAALLASFRKFLEFVLHNGPHPWVGLQPEFNLANVLTNAPLVGSMTWQASPNDPAFWLHHCNIDRLWAIWQQRHDYPGYVPQSGGPAMQDGPDVMGMFNDPSYFNFPQHATPNSNEEHRLLGYIYYSDLPEISAPSPSLNFGDVPESLTTYKPIQFSVTSCQPLKFRITAISGAGYSDPYPGAHTITPPDDSNPFTGDVYVAYHASPGSSGGASGSVTIQTFINDPDRLYVPASAPNDEYVLGEWTVSLSANVVPRPRAAVGLVLDRSGSMSLPAGGGLSRFDLLEGAVQVVADIMRDDDGMGLVYYDHNVIRRMDITAMSAAGGQAQVAAAVADPALEPSGGSTAVGSGMIEGADVLTDEMGLSSTPYSRFAMLVMTDGNENVTPYANDPPVSSAIAPFSSEVYAVGLGREGEVSDATLGAIANYMLFTGDMNADEREFRMTKYFVQILAGITNQNIVIDPPGHLTFGAEHRIEFRLTSADMEADVIALSPLAFIMNMRLEAPDGTVITPANTGPNSSFHRNMKDIFYRMRLPAVPSRPDGTHGGRWTAVLSLSRERVKEVADKLENYPHLLEHLRRGVIPYALTVHTYSNVSFDVRVELTSLLSGAKLQLFAALNQYTAPLAHRASVRVEVTDPKGSVDQIELHEDAPGSFYGEYETGITGIYRCRFLGSGHTLEGEVFTREQTRTAAVYRRFPEPARPSDGDDHDSAVICRMIACLLKDRGMRDMLKRHEIDANRLSECLRKACRKERTPGLTKGVERTRTEGIDAMSQERETDESKEATDMARKIAQRFAPLLRETGELNVLETPEPESVEAPEEQDIPMNPLGGMWPTLELDDGTFAILVKTEEGGFNPPPERWAKPEEKKNEPRDKKLPEDLLKRGQARDEDADER